MALPDVNTISSYYKDGRWNLTMLRSALMCKRITQAQFDDIVSSKESEAVPTAAAADDHTCPECGQDTTAVAATPVQAASRLSSRIRNRNAE